MHVAAISLLVRKRKTVGGALRAAGGVMQADTLAEVRQALTGGGRDIPPREIPPGDISHRDIPPLYPRFYKAALEAAGKPVTQNNIASLANHTADTLALNAGQWFKQLGTNADRKAWDRRFGKEPRDLDELARRPDEMVRSLWDWSPSTHAALCQLLSMEMHGETLVKVASQYGNELPLDMWSVN
jgi:hypothetical protein